MGTALLCAAATIVAIALRDVLAEANLVLMYLISVVIATVRWGRASGIFGSILAVLAFDVFLVEPVHSFSVADTQYLLTFAIMLSVSLVISHLMANLQQQANIAESRAHLADTQFALSKDLASASSVSDIADAVRLHLAAAFQGTAQLLAADSSGQLDFGSVTKVSGDIEKTTRVMAQAVFRGQRGDDDTDPVSATGQMHFIALRAPLGIRGVLVLANCDCKNREQIRLLQGFASQIALAIERVQYVELSASAALAMESERLRNSLLSAMSHDVRTPLAGILGLSSALANTPGLSAETTSELAKSIQDEAVRMNSLVTNLLDLARIQTGGMQIRREWQLIDEVIGSALASSGRVINEMTVELALSPALPLVQFDAVLLERVLCNLLENAARYGAAGGWIGIFASTTDKEMLVSVTDRGPGVRPCNAKRIFDKFVHGKESRNKDGVGLGLAICRSIIEAHGGKIWTELQVTGACFVFSLPLGEPPQLDFVDMEHSG